MQRAAQPPVGGLAVEPGGLLEGVRVQRAHGVRVDVDGRDPVEEPLDGGQGLGRLDS